MANTRTAGYRIQRSLPNLETKRCYQATHNAILDSSQESPQYILDKRFTSQLNQVRRVPMYCLSSREKLLLIFIIYIHIVVAHFYLPFFSINHIEVTASVDHQYFIKKSINEQSKGKTFDTRDKQKNTTAILPYKETVIRQPTSGYAPNTKQALNLNRLNASDYIYGRKWWEIPTVIEEYKLIFFTIPKVGCTEWKHLFRKMMGLAPVASALPVRYIQKPGLNNLTTLSNFSLSDAEMMLNSPEWTRAVFVREPKERILSAFMNKFVIDKFYFRNKCCNLKHLKDDNAIKTCNRMIETKNFGYFLNRTQDCKDFHWEVQAAALDEKWWPSINFVGYMHSIANDTKQLLQSLVSVKDGLSAWENVGESGWGENGKEGFMQSNTAGHGNGAQSKLRKYYTAEYESFVEEHWKKDWKMDQYHFDEFHLFDN